MIDEYQLKYRIPSLTTDAIVLRKHKSDPYHDILLVTRGNYPEEGKLAFPGGFVDYGENPENGCIRELKEETELDGKNIELLTVRGDPKRDPRRHIVSIFYVVNVDENAEPKGGDDAREAKFYDLRNILEKQKSRIAFDHYGVIVELVEKKFKELYGDCIRNNYNIKLKAKNIGNFSIDKYDKYKIGKIIDLNLEQIKNLKIDEKNIDIEINELINKKENFEKYKVSIENSFKEVIDDLNKQYNNLNRLIQEKYYQNENNNVFQKVKEILDKTIENVKDYAKDSIKKKNLNENDKLEQINKIKTITNEAIIEINELTTFIVEQSYDLIRKINENK
jgi:8-oxo-dGTP diphosphatase